MYQEVVEYGDVRITVRAARVIDGIRRTRIITEQDSDIRFTYAACVCSVAEVENLDPDISIDDFLELPDELVLLWEDAAYRANPHWLPQPVQDKKIRAAHQQELDKRLILWNKRQDSLPVMEDEDEDWYLYDLEASWKVWVLLQGLDWSHLPYEGGILEQPEVLMNDLVTISWRKSIIKEMLKPTPKGQRR